MRVNERADERMAQYLRPYSRLFRTTVEQLCTRSVTFSEQLEEQGWAAMWKRGKDYDAGVGQGLEGRGFKG